MNKEELLKEFNDKVEELKQELLAKIEQEDKEEKKPFLVDLPNDNDEFYYIDDYDNTICERSFHMYNSNNLFCYLNGSFFKTKEEAEQHLKEQRLLFKIKQWAEIHNEDWIPDWEDDNEEKHYIYYSNNYACLKTTYALTIGYIYKLPYFKTTEIAQACIDEFGEEILEVLC